MGTVAEREVSAELMAAQQLEEAAKLLDLEPWILRRLRRPEREVTVNLELIRDMGKPASMGGVDREKIAALFSRALLTVSLREQGMKLSGARVVMAGFGVEARWLASALESAGACVMAVSDRSGAVFHRNRLDVRA